MKWIDNRGKYFSIGNIFNTFLFLIIICTVFSVIDNPVEAQFSEELNVIQVKTVGKVLKNGEFEFDMNWLFPNNVTYTELKRVYPNPYVIIRDLTSSRASLEFKEAEVSYDDAQRALKVKARIPGYAVRRYRLWEIDTGAGTTLVYQQNKLIIFREIMPFGGNNIAVNDYFLELPQEASLIQFDQEAHVLRYDLPQTEDKGEPYLQVNLDVKPRIMSAAYKAYGNPELEDGDYWVAKSSFKNTGQGIARNVSISYRLGQYAPWSTPVRYGEIVPSGSVIDLYYPLISSDVSNLRNPTPVDLELKFTYEDNSGKIYEDYRTKRLSVLGINQIEFSKYSPEETSGTWLELYSNTPLTAVYVTHLDSPVKEFAGMVSQFAGGVATTMNDEQALAFCRAIYDLEVANGIVYQTSSNFLTEYSPGQDVKYPRDVLRDKSGTCVDLAILYAAACRAVGLKPYLVFIPGHAYPVIKLPSGDLLPVETTLIGGQTIGIKTFEEAVNKGMENLKNLENGRHFLVDVTKIQNEGVVSPELPVLPANILKEWGYQVPANQPIPQPDQALNNGNNEGGLTPNPNPGVNVNNISGIYQGKAYNNTTGEEATFTFRLQTQGNMVVGEAEMEAGYIGSGSIQGQIEGNRLVFIINSQVNNYPFQINCEVTINGGILQGYFTIPFFGSNGTLDGKKIQ